MVRQKTEKTGVPKAEGLSSSKGIPRAQTKKSPLFNTPINPVIILILAFLHDSPSKPTIVQQLIDS
jgi:hypothetical protein